VFRALQLGDMLCIVPALRSLRAGCPQAQVTLVGLPWARDFARRYACYIDDFIEFPGHAALPERRPRPEHWPGYLHAVQARRFDLALQMHGSGQVTNRLLGAWSAQRTAGFSTMPGAVDDPTRFLAWDGREHEVKRYVRLMGHLGMPDRGLHLEWPEFDADRGEAVVAELLGPARPYVVVHPGARLASRRWPVERFAQVADALARRGFRILATGAPDEAYLVARLVAAMTQPARDLAGRTSLGGLAALLRRASLVVCNDTGVSHVAAAVGAPSVVICSGADPVRWAPLDDRRHTVLHHPVACRPCMHDVCPVGHVCATGVEAAAVLDVALRKLGARPEAWQVQEATA
jgi:ADP-heptose:LPS heptosyltransferase